jgi:hypothetical protein
VRTREVMFRIGGEDDLLERPAAVPASASQAEAPADARPSTAVASAVSPLEDGTPMPSAAAARPAEGPVKNGAVIPEADASAPDVATRGSPPRPAVAMERGPGATPSTLVSPTLSDLDRGDRAATDDSISNESTPVVTSWGRRWRPPAHQESSRRECAAALLKSSRRPRLAQLHRCVAWVNAAIFTVLIVAAVVGHTPSSTTDPSSGATQIRQTTRPVAAPPSTRPANSGVLRKSLCRCRPRGRPPCSRKTARFADPESGGDQGDRRGEFGR